MRYNQIASNRGGERGKATYRDRIKVFKKATFSENNTKYGLVMTILYRKYGTNLNLDCPFPVL